MPFTLAKESGMGAFQFSGADYKSGKKPEITLVDLIEMRESFACQKFSVEGFNNFSQIGKIMISEKSYHVGSDYIRIWYYSNGSSIYLITYLSNWGDQGEEPEECDKMVANISFEHTT
ncbi:hypothetical protein [Luteolibacter sp. LG18]|uniref:hypothetical protein n=1 Tax=Luteolibacter sp. LG18 TaxID=2819286 RepID=UPI002B2D81DE|nr:hypothetical protein llg_32650 [Luteolibacter sp. LG18]